MVKKTSLNLADVVKHMSEKELKQYSIDVKPIDGLTDRQLILKLMTEFNKFVKQQLEFNKNVNSFITEQKQFNNKQLEFNEFVMNQFKAHGWVK